MIQKHKYLPIDLTVSPMQRAIRSSRARLALAICLLLAMAGRVADAQFSGPALGIDTEVNPPITITTDRAILFPPNREIFLGTGDVLAVHLFGNPDYSPTVRVNL